MSAFETQVAGGHYKDLAIQPVEYIHKNGLGFCEGSVVKYITRWRSKGGLDDLRKAKHFIELLIELEATCKPADATIETYDVVQGYSSNQSEYAKRER